MLKVSQSLLNRTKLETMDIDVARMKISDTLVSALSTIVDPEGEDADTVSNMITVVDELSDLLDYEVVSSDDYSVQISFDLS